MKKEEIKNIKLLYQQDRPDLITEKIENRIKAIKKLLKMIEDVESIEGELEYLGLLGGHINDHPSFQNVVRQFKKMYVEMVLRKSKWNKAKTARALKVQRTYVDRLIQQLGIKKKDAKL